MRYILALVFCYMACVASAQEWEDQRLFGAEDARVTLRVLSSTDTALMAKVLQDFTNQNQDVAVAYFVAGTSYIDKAFRRAPAEFDIVISSAMDLQFKLANDGFARPIPEVSYPGWAQWRRSVFAFTSEPATIVVNRAAFAQGSVPPTRQALIQTLRENADRFRGRVGTYDVRRSGLGYLFATQDARTSETYWRLMEVMGNLDARLYCCSGDMIEDVADGTIFVAYNVLGSYAQARADLADKIDIIAPTDFQTIMMRTVLVSDQSAHLAEAQSFLSHVLNQAQSASAGVDLPPLDLAADASEQSSIALEPSLLTYLDRLKSRRFLREWVNAVIQ
ncbi:MAG: ABC transporter substrate-binding protein [Roseobacter sp.]